MATRESSNDIRPECVDVVMEELPRMYRAGGLAGEAEFVYGVTYFAVREELRRGATAPAIRRQTSQILHDVDETDRLPHDKEHFPALLPRALDHPPQARTPFLFPS